MSLHKLKKQLKQDLNPRKSTKSRIKPLIRLLLLLLVVALGALALPLVSDYRSTELQRLTAAGIKLESLGRSVEALDKYSRVLSKYGENPEAAEALFRSARIRHFDLQDPKGALLDYLQLELDFPAGEYLLPAREAAAWIVKYDLRDDMQAIGYYQRLRDSLEGSQDQYLYEMADSYFRLENYPQARIELENLLAAYPDSPLVVDAIQRKATILILENRLEESQQDWQRLIDSYPESSYQNQARYNLAKLLEEQGELEEALEQYLQLTDFSRSLLLEQKISHLQRRIETRKEGTQ